MRIPLDQFEQLIGETILKRGQAYYKKGKVIEVEEIGKGAYEATVEGTEDYLVKFTLKAGTMTEYVCSCPYLDGPVCKHVVAVLFYLHAQEQGQPAEAVRTKEKKEARPSKGAKKKATSKSAIKKTQRQQVKDILAKASHQELIDFIKTQSEDSLAFRNLFLFHFPQYNSVDAKADYAFQIKSILKLGMNHGFIDYRTVGRVAKSVHSMIESAEKMMGAQHYTTAIHCLTAVMEEMTKALDFADDSNGDVGGTIDYAFEKLSNLAANPPTEEVRKQLYAYCLSAFEKNTFGGWDWHLGMLATCGELAKSDAEIAQIMSLIDRLGGSGYLKQSTQEIKYELLLKLQGEGAAEEYLMQNLANSTFRKRAIERAVQVRQFDKAIALCNDAIKTDQIDKPGLVTQWRQWLLKIYQIQQDTEKIIECARILLFDNFRADQDYYQLLKSHVKPAEWKGFLEGVIQDAQKQGRWGNESLITKIWIKEGWWDKLMEMIEKKPTYLVLDTYGHHLPAQYSKRLAELYAKCIRGSMGNNTSRNHYQEICKYIRKVIKLGEREMADGIIAFFRAEYPKRRALMEELDKV